jgi:hypothetical protein
MLIREKIREKQNVQFAKTKNEFQYETGFSEMFSLTACLQE